MSKGSLIPQEVIEKKIFLIRGEKVMLDKDLAESCMGSRRLISIKPLNVILIAFLQTSCFK